METKRLKQLESKRNNAERVLQLLTNREDINRFLDMILGALRDGEPLHIQLDSRDYLELGRSSQTVYSGPPSALSEWLAVRHELRVGILDVVQTTLQKWRDKYQQDYEDYLCDLANEDREHSAGIGDRTPRGVRLRNTEEEGEEEEAEMDAATGWVDGPVPVSPSPSETRETFDDFSTEELRDTLNRIHGSGMLNTLDEEQMRAVVAAQAELTRRTQEASDATNSDSVQAPPPSEEETRPSIEDSEFWDRY